MTNSSRIPEETQTAVELTEEEARRIGYKVLFSVCEDPADVAARIDGVPVSPDVAECEDAAAKKRWETTGPFHAVIEAAATWMAEVVSDDVIDEDTKDLAGDIKDEYSTDFSHFGVALIGVLIEAGYLQVVPR